MDNARTRFLKLISCIQCGSIENAPAQLVTDLDKQMYACAIDNDTYNDELVVFTVAETTPYSSGWLSLTDGGVALTPSLGVLYIVSSAGDYKDKIYRWTGTTYLLLGGGKQTFIIDTTVDSDTTIAIVNQVSETLTTSAEFGDTLTITATAATGHHIDTLIVNGVAFTSGETMIVAGHITISATSIINTYDLSVDDTNCTVEVLDDTTPVTPGTDVLEYGQELTITATAETGYTLDTLTVNGEVFVSGAVHTVTGDVAIVGTAV